jgi:hypothetical protein
VNLQFQRSDPDYIDDVDSWLSAILVKVAPYMYSKGGPIITIKIENEYDFARACDQSYLKYLAARARSILRDDAVLFTNDATEVGPEPGIEANFKTQRDWNGPGPYVDTEFYLGWLDH